MHQKSLLVVGPSATGKTTLCRALAQKLGLNDSAVVFEVAREVMRDQGYTRKDVGRLDMQIAIMEAHVRRELERKDSAIHLCDRSAIDPIVYAMLTAPDGEEAKRRRDALVNSPTFQRVLPLYQDSYSTFVLMAPVPEWQVDDGVRSLESQEECFELFRAILKELGIPYREMGPDMRRLEERVSTAMSLLRL